MTAQEAIAYIENYTWSTTRLGLDRTRRLLQALGDPQKRLKFIHVAGSNGKGSTCAMLDSVLRAAGYRVGLYTSPYLQDFCERMQVNGQNIDGSDLARITEQVRAFADGMEDHPSQFELVTAIAMQYFMEQRCDIVVLEVGMGGALDSTNVIDCPEAAVITNIGLEHTEYLGNTLAEIARTKGGIVKPGCTAVCYDSVPDVMDTLRAVCLEQGASFRVSRAEDLQEHSHSLEGQLFSWKGRDYRLPLLGQHQLRNAGTALETLSALREKGWDIPESAVAEGLRRVTWPARFEVLDRNPLFILDGGHNPQCADALAANLREYLPGQKLCVLLGVLRDKDYRQMLRSVAPFASQVICVTPDSPRALPAAELAEEVRSLGLEASVCDRIRDGVRQSLETLESVLAFGSLYLAGHVRTLFPQEKKRLQRQTALQRRDSLPPEKRAADSAAVCRAVLSSGLYRNAGTIFLFRAFGSEVDLSAVADQAERDGKTVLYPVCTDRTRMLAVETGGAWKADFCGILSPAPDQSSAVEAKDIDLVLCPCSAFDGEGRRLGMGRGYYDRFLPQCLNAAKVLVAFEAQRLERVFTEGRDIPMDAAVTEAGLVLFPAETNCAKKG